MVVEHSTGQLVRSLVRIPGSGMDRQASPTCLDLSNVSSLAASIPVPKTLPRALARPRQNPSATSNTLSDLIKEEETSRRKKFAIVNPVQQEAAANNRKRSLTQLLLGENNEESQAVNPPAPKAARTTTAHVQSQQFQVAPSVGPINQATQVFVGLFPVTSGVILQAQPQQQVGNRSTSLQNYAMPADFAGQLIQLPVMQTGMVQMRSLQNVTPQTLLVGQQTPIQPDTSRAASIPNQHQNQAATSSVSTLLQEMNKLKKENEAMQQRLTKFQNIFKSKESLQHIARTLAISTQA